MALLVLTACVPRQVDADTIAAEAGLKLCSTADVRDVSTPAQKDTVPGFSYTAEVRLDPACQADLVAQAARLAGSDCPAEWVRRNGCFFIWHGTSVILSPVEPKVRLSVWR